MGWVVEQVVQTYPHSRTVLQHKATIISFKQFVFAGLYPNGYRRSMNTLLRTDVFDRWLSQLKDAQGKARVVHRVRSAERGNFGDCRLLESGIAEIRIHSGPGYRVYLARRGRETYVLLCGGTKRGQQRDIARARQLARFLMED